MSESIFVTNAKLEEAVESGEVTFIDDIITVAASQTAYKVTAAAKVTGLLDGEDTAGWVGKTLSVSVINAAGAEHFQDSIILGETAYQCIEGFLGARQGAPASTPPPLPKAPEEGAPLSQPTPEGETAPPATDMDLLTDFMLKNM